MYGVWRTVACSKLRFKRDLTFMSVAKQFLIYSRLSLYRNPRDSMKYFEISVPLHIRFAELRKTIIRTTTFNKYAYICICNWTLDVRDILKMLWKRGEIAP